MSLAERRREGEGGLSSPRKNPNILFILHIRVNGEEGNMFHYVHMIQPLEQNNPLFPQQKKIKGDERACISHECQIIFDNFLLSCFYEFL